MKIRIKFFLLLICSFLVFPSLGFSENTDTSLADLSGTVALKDEPLADYQHKLLDLAFDTATKIPVNPHIKDRSRMQEEVITILFKLDQPQKAQNLIDKIEDWRQGSAYADLAFYCAQHGYNDGAEKFLSLATKISEKAEDWRRDTIKVKIARTYAFMGQMDKSQEFEENVVDSEMGKIAAVKAMGVDKDSFNEQMKAIDDLIIAQNFEILKNALYSSTELYNKLYDDKKKRTKVENKIKTSWNKMPLFIRIELLMNMSQFSLDHGDQKKSLKLVNEAQEIFDGAVWPLLEFRIALGAKLISLRGKSGDLENAKSKADELRNLFEIDRDKIVNIYRAGAIRPLAEAYQAMGDSVSAMTIYKKAIEEGMENPNSRPRAEDLTATLISMAANQADPDEELWKRIREINQGLSEPW